METRIHKLIAGATVLTSVLTLNSVAFTRLAIAQSAPANIELAQLLPADIDQFSEFNTGVANPFRAMVDSWLNETVNGGMSSMSTLDAATLKEILTGELKNNKISYAVKNVMVKSDYGDYSYPEAEMYASIHMTAEDYNKLTTFFPTDVKKETVDGYTVYNPSYNMFVTMVGNLTVMASTHDRMSAFLDMYTQKTTAKSLAQTDGYSSVRAKDLPDSFFNMYINPGQYQTLLNDLTLQNDAPTAGTAMADIMKVEKDLLADLNAEGISLAQTDTGYNFGIIIKGDQAKLTQLNLNFDRYNFVPALYKYVNSRNIMLFGEESNLQEKFKILMQLFVKDPASVANFTQWKNNLKTQADIDFDTDILPLFAGKYTLSLHKTGQIYPAVTLAVDVHDMQQKAAGLLAKLVNYLDKIFNQVEKDEGVNFYNRDVSSFNGTSFYRMAFDPNAFADADPGFKNLPKEKTVININAAVTNQGLLVITNAPDVSDVYTLDNKGMMNNPSFGAAYTNPGETVSGLGYFSFDGLRDYGTLLMDTFSAPTEVRGLINGILDPWHDMFTIGYGMPETAYAKGFVNVDTAGLAKYGDLFNKYMNMGTETAMHMPTEMMPQFKAKFCDVHDADWFAPYVTDLSQNGIVSGYRDGCFKPGNEITRAEFIKMAMEASGKIYPPDPDKTWFTDVKNHDDWFAPYIDSAASQNLITGYPDGTFRPNAPITRAEAVQMLYTMSSQLIAVNTVDQPIDSLIHFNDVSKNDWFMTPVAASYYYNLVDGVSADRFEPNRNLNRAEAAKIIKLFRDLENAGTTTTPGMLLPQGSTQQTTPGSGPNIY